MAARHDAGRWAGEDDDDGLASLSFRPDDASSSLASALRLRGEEVLVGVLMVSGSFATHPSYASLRHGVDFLFVL